MKTVEPPSPSAFRTLPSDAGYPPAESLPLQRAYYWERHKPRAVFLTQPLAGKTRDWSWREAMGEARRVAAYLSAQNWPPGSRIVIISKNCAWWLMAELAIWMSGHTTVPIYPSLSAASVRTLLNHCEPVACFIGSFDDKNLLTDGIPPQIRRITFPIASDPGAIAWDAIVKTTKALQGNPTRPGDDIATIIYTSGTTGAPKGAMHRFSSFAYFATAALRAHGKHKAVRMLSYLTLAHVAERALVEAVALEIGSHLYFAESLDTFITDLRRARPTVFFSVPRLYLKFQQKVLEKVPQEKLNRLLRIPLVSRYVRRKIRKQLGLDCVRLSASGSAPLPNSVLMWFRKIGLNLVEGYGMTETGITHTPPDGRSKPGYVGDSIPGVETKLGDNGEVLIRSPMNMVGYYRNPEATSESFTPDGFFKTGDLGEIDSEGWLKIIGRVKEQFKTSKGKYISPSAIEKLVSASPLIEESCVMGVDTPQPFAIVTLSEAAREQLEQPEGRDQVGQELKALVVSVNAQLETHERLQFLVVTDQRWTIANGILTPTMKLKRGTLEAMYRQLVATWTSQNSILIWHFERDISNAQQAGS